MLRGIVMGKRFLRVGIMLMVIFAALLATSACGGGEDSAAETTLNGAAPGNADSGDAVALRYTYDVGDAWAHELVTVTEATAEGFGEDGGAEAVPTSQTKVRVTTTVAAVDDGVATLGMVYETLESVVDGQAQALDATFTQDLTVRVDQTGKIVQDQATTTSGAPSEGLITGQMFDPSDFSSQFSIIYPESGQAKVGEEWTQSSTVPMPSMGQDLTVNTKAKLTGVSSEGGRETAAIEYETNIPLDMTIDLGALFGDLMGGTEAADLVFVMSIKGDLSYAGTARVDRATGQSITSDSTGSMKFEMSITDASEELVPLDQRGPFATDMSITMTAKEVEVGATSAPTAPTEGGTTTSSEDSGAEEPEPEPAGITHAEDLSPTIVLPAGWAMDQALTAADVEAVISRSGYTYWPEPNSDAAAGKPAGSFYDGSQIDTKIMFRAYTQGGSAEYERLAGFVIEPQEIAADLWDKLIVGTDKFSTDPLITALILRGDVCMSIQWRPEQYSDIDPLDLAVGLADMFVAKLFKAQ
ncbi:MAG: hypothetical protein JW990_16455 [Thermoleophilia bacterium]|nr:hypothetical protein [Thermoleophilia bacterium]